MKKKISISTKLLSGLVDLAGSASNQFDAFLLSRGSASQLKKNLHLLDGQFYSAFHGLERHGYIKKINENQFLVTPKAFVKIHREKILGSIWDKEQWDGFWRIVAFDIPEIKRHERDIFRSVIKRKGFIGLQNSVFISPYADFEELAELRADLKIEKYVTFLVSKTYKTEDDSNLRKRFGL